MRMRKGFTVIELIVAVAVMTLLLTATFVEFRAGKGEKDLAVAGDQVFGNILALQQRAGSNIVECSNGVATYGVGIDLDTERYLLFADCDEDGWYTQGTDIQVDTGESEILVDNVGISDFYDGADVIDTGKQTFTFAALSREVRVNGALPLSDRASFIINLNDGESCMRIDVWTWAKSVGRNASPSCDPSLYESE